ncbi:MAG: formyl transferase, partial [Bosea sp. (in: a-proteobacteria)]
MARDGLSARVTESELTAFERDAGAAGTAGPPELTLDLCGADGSDDPGIWRLTYDGVAGETALLSSLLAGHLPVVALVEGSNPIATGRPGTEYGGVLLASFEDVLARIVTLCVAAVTQGASRALPALPGDCGHRATTPLPDHAGLVGIAAKKLAGAVARRLYRLCCNAPHWRTGWRKLDGPDLYDLRRHPDAGWRDLPDDGRRFYADPFPILHQGRLTLFLEDYEHSVGKGIISALPFDANGPVGQPVPVLEQPGHLSYPFVFARDGEVWMIPESGEAGAIDLFRASAFPGGWVHEARLVADVVASDATLVEHGGRWWMFATVRD